MGNSYGCWSTGNVTDEILNEYLEHLKNANTKDNSNFIIEYWISVKERTMDLQSIVDYLFHSGNSTSEKIEIKIVDAMVSILNLKFNTT